jgi:serine protease Do
MLKKTFLFWSVAIIVGLTLLSGCSLANVNSPSSTPPVQNAPALSQPLISTEPPVTSILSPNSPSTTLPSATGQPTVSGKPNVIVNLPSFADLLDLAGPSVVEIDTSGTTVTSRGRTVQEQGAGSGWIMDSNGTIVTNNHVIEGASSITVTTSDGKTFPAQVVNADAINDLALIKINATQLQAIKIGDASKLRRGDWVLAVGNPLGQGIVATQGIVSRLGVSVSVSSTQTYNDLIETTAAINPGNSGGPLINMAGEVIGITSLGVSASGVEGMGYAINMVDALPVIQRLSSK